MGDAQSGADITDRLVGRTLDGRYRVVQRLGEGGMSVVYRAEQTEGPAVAIKVLHEGLGNDPKLRERFEREARALFGLTHPNILDVHDFGIVDGAPYLAMELLEGTTLDSLFEEGPPEPDVALDLAKQVLTGLAHAHSHGVLHRDLKTENVFVMRGSDGRWLAKLLDFGLVKFVDEERWGAGVALTTFGQVFGTPAYMAPEQAAGTGADARSDVYAVGIILFELLTGVWPFMEEDRVEMFRAHMIKPPPTLKECRPGTRFAPELEALVAKTLAKAPDERFADAGEMLQALEQLPRPAAWRSGAKPAGPDGSSPPAQSAPRRPPANSSVTSTLPPWVPWLGLGVAAAAVFGLAVGIVLLLLL